MKNFKNPCDSTMWICSPQNKCEIKALIKLRHFAALESFKTDISLQQGGDKGKCIQRTTEFYLTFFL